MSKTSKYIYFAICYAFFIFVNIYTSNIVVESLANGFKLDNPVFSLNYVKNTGAAFSILKDAREILIILAVVALVLLIMYVIKHIKKISLKECFFIALLSGGIAGNLHERIAFGYVRDFFQINLFNFPVFNISDIFINVGVIALIILIILKRTK